jgi:hypothetical protein
MSFFLFSVNFSNSFSFWEIKKDTCETKGILISEEKEESAVVVCLKLKTDVR